MKKVAKRKTSVIKKTIRKPHPIDMFVGKRVKQFRQIKGVTQKQLAKRIGKPFQQVQKYERATNRISASVLYQICEALDTTIPEFFADLYKKQKGKGEIMEIIAKMSPRKRQHFIKIGKILAEND